MDERQRTEQHLRLVNEISKQHLRYALPIYYGNKDGKVIDNGTGMLIETDNELIGVTALHCITRFEEKTSNDPTIKFYFGNYSINPLGFEIARNDKLDLVTLKFPKELLSLITSTPNNSSTKLIVTFDDIYQEELQPNNIVTFGGFPGSYRRQPHDYYALFGTVSFGPCTITTASPLRISCRLEKVSNWIQTHYMDGDFTKVGGLSGGPVFVATHSNIGIWYQKLAGFIYEGHYYSDDDILDVVITPARVIQRTGHIVNY